MRHHKLALATATALTAAVALVGCTAAPEPADDSPKTVTMWVYPVIFDEPTHKAYWDGVIDAFEAEHKNITVEYEVFPWANRDQALTTAIAGGKGPDLVYLVPDQLSVYADSIEPIGPYLSDEKRSSFLDNVADAVTINGNMMGVPVLTSAYPLLCNKAAFKAAGVTEYPETWEELMDLAPTFKEHGIYATEYFGAPEVSLNNQFYPWLWQAGGSVFNEDGTGVAFNSDAGVEALQFLVDLAKNGYIPKDMISTTPAFEQSPSASNKVACTTQNSPNDLKPFWGEDNIHVGPPLTNKESVAYGTVGSLSLLKGSDAKEAAAEFASFASDAENLAKYDVAAGYFSPLKEGGGLYPDDALQTAVEATLSTVTVGELNPHSREVMGVLAPEIQAALLGTKTAEQALDDAASAAAQFFN
ncbi:sugar ABC transporter substrate-binding protein [Leifsonia bigeumensis]|uniref:Sugar ABC transporter substrate-binding protein n=1 Tax=Leifsonella bigeumensis TaxID=433643 RepID=A0ABP7F844_9MICO